MSAGRELQVDAAATEKARWASSVCMRGMTSSGASEEHRARGDAWVCTSSPRWAIYSGLYSNNYSYVCLYDCLL